MFEYTLTARFDDVDYAERVYYARLFDYAHIVEEERFAALGYSLDELKEERDLMFVLANVEGDFLGAVEFRDEVRIELTVAELGTSSLHLHERGFNETAGHQVFEIDQTRVCTDVGEGDVRPIPGYLRTAVENHVESAGG